MTRSERLVAIKNFFKGKTDVAAKSKKPRKVPAGKQRIKTLSELRKEIAEEEHGQNHRHVR
jgi:hypothetical protein